MSKKQADEPDTIFDPAYCTCCRKNNGYSKRNWILWSFLVVHFCRAYRGHKSEGVVRCDQPRVLDLKARSGRKIASLPPDIMQEVLVKLVTLFPPTD